MKTALAIISVILFQSQGVSQSPKPFVLRGSMQGKDTGIVYFFLYHTPGLDSCFLKKGHFIFKGEIAEPILAYITTIPPGSQATRSDISGDFYIEPGEMNLLLNRDYTDIQLTGSATDLDRQHLMQLQLPIRRVIQRWGDSLDIVRDLQKEAKKDDSDSTIWIHLKSKGDSIYFGRIDPLYKQLDKIDSAFIIEHPNSFVAADMLSKTKKTEINFPSLAWLYNRMPETLKGSVPGKQILKKIQEEETVPIGGYAHNFIATDSKGREINLTDFKGKKYVLIDFWASWCGPCREMTPTLRTAYQQYKTELEIISISDESKEGEWKRAIAQDGMSWPQILENDQVVVKNPSGKSISETYGVLSIPTFILLDKELRIIKKFGGGFSAESNEQLKSELNSVLGTTTKKPPFR
ncbi:MAG: TlpA disulfide reductase family protein [Bacteroidota bacterium]|nr:TlpA disulfide reductase family protein [Bacteroidota bacterium]